MFVGDAVFGNEFGMINLCKSLVVLVVLFVITWFIISKIKKAFTHA